MTEIDIIEPFRQGAMVQFAHKLGNAFCHTMDHARVVGSAGFELANLHREYEFIEGFDIPRDDKAGGGASRSPVARLGRGVSRVRVLGQFLAQYRRAIDGVIERQSDFTLMATIFRYPRMPHFLSRLRKAGVRPMQICHEYQMREERKTVQARILHRLNASAYEHFHCLFFLSESQRDGFAQAFPHIESRRLVVIPCGNAELFDEIKTSEPEDQVARRYGLDPEIPTVLFFGRVRPDKGVEDLIDAFAIVRERRAEPVQLMLAGHATPSYLTHLRRRVDEVGLGTDVVFFPEYVDAADVWPLHRIAGAAVFPYRSSSQSAAVQTAMASERPIIVSDVGGLGETIVDGHSGRVVPPRSPDAIATAITGLLDDPEGGRRLGAAAGHESRTTYAWETIAQQMTEAAHRLG